jgi:hypothetical protein
MAAGSRREVPAVKNIRMLTGIALASLLALSVVPATRADQFNQATKIEFSSPVRVPGQVLSAGTYWFVLADHGRRSRVVQIFNTDRSTLIDTFTTAYAERREPTGKTVLTFAEPDSAENPNADIPALTEWFYPGRDFGHEFIYSNWRENQLQREAEVTVPVGHGGAVLSGE